MARGGYEAVTGSKQWKDICRCLDLDLTGQTSASYNMRLNYERCLLDFENYCACGQVRGRGAAGVGEYAAHNVRLNYERCLLDFKEQLRT